ncbi:MAG TPA: nucleotidyltransferase family protein [Thermoanaerobaculia bacterium]|nr:nucleotidyltransferase family protein [Thermoanaerobaculia bacterium]
MQRDRILEILRKQGAELRRRGVASLRLFGSVARGDERRDSDVDLLVAFDETPTYSEFMQLRIFLEDLLGYEVDLVTESGLRDRVRPYVEEEAIRVA